ncbi:hypothetical protein [Mycobacterium sp. BK086]|uniref:hypothetical protein n=1 Tax=Mycobacterium sp. BK086 TaxID=2512165 RepID=UPI00105BE143|nr:hypothetical protein [Mycobacterium sp. BK086]
MVKESEALASLRAEWAPTAGERQRVARADRSERLAAWVNLSFRADDVDAAIPAFAPEPDDDPSDIETYLDEVGGLINAAEELTDAVHEAVLEAFGGDVARLRQMKRDVRRANLAKQGLHENQVLPGFDEDDDPPQRSPRPMVILSLTGPDKGGLRVVTHEESKSIPRETYEIVCAFEPGASDEAALAAARTILRSRDPDKAYRPDNSPVDEAPPLEFRDAARSTPTGYLKGKSDQGEPPDGA